MVEEKNELKRELCVLIMIACCWHFKVIYVSWIIGRMNDVYIRSRACLHRLSLRHAFSTMFLMF